MYLLNFGIEALRLTEQLAGEATIHATGNALNHKLVGNNQNNILDGVAEGRNHDWQGRGRYVLCG